VQLPYVLQFWLVALRVAPWFTRPQALRYGLQHFSLALLGSVVWTCLVTDRKHP
jgi:hypothetical protein